MRRGFADANVLIAGAGSPSGASRAVLTMAEIGLFRLVVCRQVLDCRQAMRRYVGAAPPGASVPQHNVPTRPGWLALGQREPRASQRGRAARRGGASWRPADPPLRIHAESRDRRPVSPAVHLA